MKLVGGRVKFWGSGLRFVGELKHFVSADLGGRVGWFQ